MYIGYIKDRQDLGFMCRKDIESGKTLIFKIGSIYIAITIMNSSLFMSNFESINQSYSDKPSCERLISSISNQNTLKGCHNRGLNVKTENVKDYVSSIDLITKLRCGSNHFPENPDQSLEKVNESLKESLKLDKLERNLASKSGENPKSFTDNSLNKIIIGMIDKMEPIIGDSRFWRILAETKKPVKVELSTSVKSSSSKDIQNPKPQKISGKRSSSIFAEALVPINPRRWPGFVAGSAMASEMPGSGDKVATPFTNLVTAKEYLETAHSDIQWRGRLWQIAQDTATINFASELGGDAGSFMAGAASNKIADGYMNKMVETEVTKNQQEKFNLEMFKQRAHELGKDASKVRGTGVRREFVPDFMQEDICDRPERNARPNSWEDTGSGYSYDDKSSFN